MKKKAPPAIVRFTSPGAGGRALGFARHLHRRHTALSLAKRRTTAPLVPSALRVAATPGHEELVGPDDSYAPSSLPPLYAGEPRPELAFAMPIGQASLPITSGLPLLCALEKGGGTGAIGSDPSAQANATDTVAVADRVYELMKQEVVLARQRGAASRHVQRRV